MAQTIKDHVEPEGKPIFGVTRDEQGRFAGFDLSIRRWGTLIWLVTEAIMRIAGNPIMDWFPF